MKRLFGFCLALVLPASAFAIDLNLSGGTARVTNSTEFTFDNVRFGNMPGLSWGRFKWNAQMNSFVLVDLGTMTPSAEGRWNLFFDVNCTGSQGQTTWTLNRDGSCISGENRTCRWQVASDGAFTLTYLTGGRTTYVGRYAGGSMNGTFASPDGRVRGCWSATKMLRMSFAPNQADPRTHLDSSGSL